MSTKNIFTYIPIDALMNVYFYLPTRDLVKVISVSRDAKYSIKEKYDCLPITQNTVRDTKLCNHWILHNGGQVYLKPSCQISSTLRRSIHHITFNINYDKFDPLWFKNINSLDIQSNHCENMSDINLKLRLIMSGCSATKLYYNLYLPFNPPTNIKIDLSFPPDLKYLTLYFNGNCDNSDEYITQSNQNFPEKLTELVVIGAVTEKYLNSSVLKPGLILNKLTVKNNTKLLCYKPPKCHALEIIDTLSFHYWNVIFEWAAFIDLHVPDKLSITCLVFCGVIDEITDSNSFNLHNFNLENSPLENLEMITWIDHVYIAPSLHQYSFERYISIMELLITSKILPRLKSVLLEIQLKNIEGARPENVYYQATIQGVVLKVNKIFVVQYSTDRHDVST